MERGLSPRFHIKFLFLSSFLTEEFASQSFTSPNGADLLLPGLVPVVYFSPGLYGANMDDVQHE